MNLSIITINRNNASGLEKTIQSVLCQSLRDFKYVIVDGASTDGSVDVIREYAGGFGTRLKWVSEPDKGIYNAMNKGIKAAESEYVMILNSGDSIAGKDVLKNVDEALLRINMGRTVPLDILLGNIVTTGAVPNKRVKKDGDMDVSIPDISMLTFYRGTVPHDAAIMRKRFLLRYGLYDEDMKICSDWKLFMHAIALGEWRPLGDQTYHYIPPVPADNIRHIDLDMVVFDMTGISERNRHLWDSERRPELERSLPVAILKDYDRHSKDILMMRRIHRHPILFSFVRLMERFLFKLEKWGLVCPLDR